MQVYKTTFATSVLAAVIGAASVQAPSAYAEAPVDMNIHEINGEIHLIVKREGINNETHYEKIVVPTDEANAREAELLLNPNVISIERDVVSFNPIPLTERAPSLSQSATYSQSTSSVSYSDPLFSQQNYFDVGDSRNTRLGEAHGRLNFDNTARVGVVDGGFVQTPEVTYAEGASQNYGKGADFYNSDPGIECPNLAPGADKSTHGHWVSQVLAANSDNGLGIAGAAPNVELVAARSMDCMGTGFMFENSESVRWLAGESITDVPDISEPVDVINMSVVNMADCPAYMQDAVDYARARGIVVIAAAGNDSNDSAAYSPGNCDGVITVAATTSSGSVASYSNLGGNITVSAQGSDMPVLDDEGNSIVIFGTSFSTPLVSGVIASALSDRPNLTPAEIDTILITSGKPVVSTGTPEVGAGILDAMLFLDGAGVPRESTTFESALGGEREQYESALVHPAATAYLQAQTGASGACDIYEVDGEALDTPTADDRIAVFSVAAGEPLDPTNTTASIINSTADIEDLVISQADIDTATGSNRQLGVAHCNLTTGANCSVKDTVKALSTDSVALPASCS